MSKKSKDIIPAEDNLWVRLMLRANEERDVTDLGDTVLADLLEEAATKIRAYTALEKWRKWRLDNGLWLG